MAVWERVRMIPFDVYIPPHERDPYLQEKLRAELPGILTWAVDGCLAWQVGVNGSPSGLRPPEEVTQATEAYHREMDDLGEFLDERCLRSDLVRVDGKDLYQAYVDWCAHENQPPMHVRTFALDLQHRGVTRQKSNGKVWYKGIALKDISSD
jgi:putative DNA primase/helicase